MSGTVLDHPLVRGYLDQLDTALRGVPAAQASELREQITAHLDDALWPNADDHEVAATLRRLGSPADLAAEVSGVSRPSGFLGVSGFLGLRRRWRPGVVLALIGVIGVPTVVAAVFGGARISGDVNNVGAFGRDLQLAQLNGAVVRLSQKLEDERDLSAAFSAGAGGSAPAALARARLATDAAARTVRADAAGVGTGAGYQPGTVKNLNALLASVTDLGEIRRLVSSRGEGAAKVISVYTDDVIGPANTFSTAVGNASNDVVLQGTVTTLATLLAVENEQSVQRGILYAALSARPPVLGSYALTGLTQAFQQEQSDLADFNAAAGTDEQQHFASTVSGPAVDSARAQEDLAEARSNATPRAPLTSGPGLDAATWYSNKSTEIGDTRLVTDQLAGQLIGRANTLKSNATKRLLLAGAVALILVLVFGLLSALALVRGRSL